MKGYETFVRLVEDDMVKAKATDESDIRALVFQDDTRRTKEIGTLYSRIGELENKLSGKKYDAFARKKLSPKEREIQTFWTSVRTMMGIP